jgi:hypothetical protein
VEIYWQLGLAAMGLSLLGVVGFVWHAHARATQRWHAALDAYAQREIARERRRRALRRVHTFSTALGLSDRVATTTRGRAILERR